jgi:hypothetical protein
MKCCLSAAAQVNPFTAGRTGAGIEDREREQKEKKLERVQKRK